MIKPVLKVLVVFSIFLMAISSVLPAQAQTSRRNATRPAFDFLAPPSSETNRIYRVNIFSGEMGVCWYSKKGNVDLTECLNPGPGAGPQARGLYTLVASNMKTERGVFRLNLITGEVSMCWVKGDVLTCTPQAR